MGFFFKSPEEYYQLGRETGKRKYYEKAAEAGHVDAMWQLSQDYDISKKKREPWLEKAAQMGHHLARHKFYQHIYKSGKEELGRAHIPVYLQWLQEDAAQGHIAALSVLGQLYLNTSYSGYDPQKGLELLEQAAASYNEKAVEEKYGVLGNQYVVTDLKLAAIYQKGWYVWRNNNWVYTNDKKRALYWYKAAAERDPMMNLKEYFTSAIKLDPEYALAAWNEYRQGKTLEDFKKEAEAKKSTSKSKTDYYTAEVMEPFRIAQEQEKLLKMAESGNVSDGCALTELAQTLLREGKLDKGLMLIEQAKAAQYGPAFMLSGDLRSGKLKPDGWRVHMPFANDIEVAIRDYRKAWAMEIEGAKEALEDQINKQKAFKAHLEAALTGDLQAMIRVSECLTYGTGIDFDLKKAMAFSMQAVEIDLADTEKAELVYERLTKAKQGDLNCFNLLYLRYKLMEEDELGVLDRPACQKMRELLYAQYVMALETQALRGDAGAQYKLYQVYGSLPDEKSYEDYEMSRYWGDLALKANYGPMYLAASNDPWVYKIADIDRRQYAQKAVEMGVAGADVVVKLFALEDRKAREWEQEKRAILGEDRPTPTASDIFNEKADKAERWGYYLASGNIEDLFYTTEERYIRGKMSLEEYLDNSWMRGYFELMYNKKKYK